MKLITGTMQSNYILTGSIASGKTTVLEMISSLGYNTISADELVKELYQNTDFLHEFKTIIGEEYFIKGIELDFAKLRSDLFSVDSFKAKVEAFVHPSVYKLAKERLVDGINFIEVPLYFEAKEYFDESNIAIEGIIYVYVERDLQIKRLMARNDISKEEAQKRLDTRLSTEEKIKKSDYLINNDGDLEKLKEKVLITLEKINEKIN